MSILAKAIDFVFYKSLRVGLHGKLFNLYKFRSMIHGAERVGGFSTSKDDKRITAIGKYLRKYKIDELPQLWNVIKRDMNIVGCRPTVPEVINTLSEEEKRVILSIRPGITDLASLWNYNEEERLAGKDNPHEYFMKEIYPEIKRLQIYYVKNKSIWLDIKIITQTLWKIIKR